MNTTEILDKTKKFTIDNSPLLLTVVGAIGIAGTAYLSGRAGFKAAQILKANEEYYNLHKDLTAPPWKQHVTLKDKLVMTWKCYVPACGVGLVTLGAVVGSNHISTSRSAALATAFTISQEAAEKYKAKVVEKLGETKEKQVVDAVAQQRVKDNPPVNSNGVIMVGTGEQVFQDSWSGRYFRSDMEAVRRAVNDLNMQVNHHGHATLTDFYDMLGMSKTLESDEVGWNTDELLDVFFSAAVHDEGNQAVMCVEYRVVPTRDYFRTH